MNWNEIKDLSQCDFVIHLAAKTFVPFSFKNPREFYKVNLELTLNALELARLWNAKFVNLNSYIYGSPQYIPVDEYHPINPHNPYSESKYISECICKSYSRDFGVPVISFRLFNVYGPEQSNNFLIPEIIHNIKKSNSIILKDPRPKRDYIHVDDVIKAIILSLNYTGLGFEVFNLGTGTSLSVQSIINIIQTLLPFKFDVSYTHDYRKGEVLDSVADVASIKKKLNWSYQIEFIDGIKDLLELN
jgi:UDP-glucose 4-epimerase